LEKYGHCCRVQPDSPEPHLVGNDYDQLVCELAFDTRSQPKDRTKAAEIFQEQRECWRTLKERGKDEGKESDEESGNWHAHGTVMNSTTTRTKGGLVLEPG
jgi:hypothetical protein